MAVWWGITVCSAESPCTCCLGAGLADRPLAHAWHRKAEFPTAHFLVGESERIQQRALKTKGSMFSPKNTGRGKRKKLLVFYRQANKQMEWKQVRWFWDVQKSTEIFWCFFAYIVKAYPVHRHDYPYTIYAFLLNNFCIFASSLFHRLVVCACAKVCRCSFAPGFLSFGQNDLCALDRDTKTALCSAPESETAVPFRVVCYTAKGCTQTLIHIYGMKFSSPGAAPTASWQQQLWW